MSLYPPLVHHRDVSSHHFYSPSIQMSASVTVRTGAVFSLQRTPCLTPLKMIVSVAPCWWFDRSLQTLRNCQRFWKKWLLILEGSLLYCQLSNFNVDLFYEDLFFYWVYSYSYLLVWVPEKQELAGTHCKTAVESLSTCFAGKLK